MMIADKDKEAKRKAALQNWSSIAETPSVIPGTQYSRGIMDLLPVAAVVEGLVSGGKSQNALQAMTNISSNEDRYQEMLKEQEATKNAALDRRLKEEQASKNVDWQNKLESMYRRNNNLKPGQPMNEQQQTELSYYSQNPDAYFGAQEKKRDRQARVLPPLSGVIPTDIKDPVVQELWRQGSKQVAPEDEAGQLAQQNALSKFYDLYKPQSDDWVTKLLAQQRVSEQERVARRPLPANETDKISALDDSFNRIDSVLKNFDERYVGPLAGRWGTVKQFFSALPEGEAKFRTSLAEVKNITRNALFGAALTPSEAKAFEEQMANPNMTPEVFKSLLEDLKNKVLQRRTTSLQNLSTSYLTEDLMGKSPDVKRTFATEEEALRSGVKGRVIINGKPAEIY